MNEATAVLDQEINFRNPIIAVLILDSVDDAVPTALSLVEGGVRSVEPTLRTGAALEAVVAIRRGIPEMTICAGTVIFPNRVKRVLDAESDFAVAPGLNPVAVEESLRHDLPFARRGATPSRE